VVGDDGRSFDARERVSLHFESRYEPMRTGTGLAAVFHDA